MSNNVKKPHVSAQTIVGHIPPRLKLAQLPTPLQPLDRLSQQLGGPRIWIKRDDLTGSVLSGNKVRKLEFNLAQALAEELRYHHHLWWLAVEPLPRNGLIVCPAWFAMPSRLAWR